MKRDRFVRWQKITIDQLGYAVNLILVLSTASLGFAVSLLVKKDFTPACQGKMLFLLSILVLLISIGLGIFCTINRLVDFRMTKEIARRRENNSSDKEFLPLRLKSKDYGARTWRLFWCQIGTFAFSILTFIVCVAVTYHQKLF
jgi:hypothetical protein